MAFPPTPVALVTNKFNTRLDVNRFPSILLPVHQRLHADSAIMTGETLWPAPYDTDQKINLLDLVLSTDTAINMALYQALLADYVTKLTADGATHLWKLDEASGSPVSSIGSKTLTAVGSPTYAAESWVCADGKSIDFNGTNQGFKTTSKIASSTTGALEAWVWLNTNTGSTKVYMSAGDEGTSSNYIRCGVQTNFLPQFILQQTAGGFLQNATAKYRVPNRTWTHIVWQLDATAGLQCFINGQQVACTISNTGAGWYDDIYSVVDNFTIGYHEINTTANWFAGRLANVAWYSAEKSAAVWKAHYEMGAALFGPHYFAANGGAVQANVTPILAQAGRSIYVRTSSSAKITLDAWGYEAE